MANYIKQSVFILLLLVGVFDLCLGESISGCCASRKLWHPCKRVPNEFVNIKVDNEDESICSSNFCMDGTIIKDAYCCDRAECTNGCSVNGKCFANSYDNWFAAMIKFAHSYGINDNLVDLVPVSSDPIRTPG